MIQFNIDNALRPKIHRRHTVMNWSFRSALKKYQPLVKEVFKNKSKMGYAFLSLTDDEALVRKIKSFAKKQSAKKWENIVVLGIGGSALGLIALRDAIQGPLANQTLDRKLFVIDNVDPDYMSQVVESINIKKSLFIVISKSGSTVEPMTLFSYFKEKLLTSKVKKWQDHFVFITDAKKGLLRPMGKKEGVEMFEVPDKVGGRFSVLSSVGLLPAALVGININSLLKGAAEMKKEIKKLKLENNPALVIAVLQYLLDKKKGKNMTVMMPYSNRLFKVGDWYRQLLAESIGKNEKSGPTPVNALGTTDQHSQLQLYSQGPNDKWFIFLKVEKFKGDQKLKNHLPDPIGFLNQKKVSTILNAALQGTSDSLSSNNRPNITLTVEKVDEKSVGALFMLFEFQVALLGYLYGVDAFNQPGVEGSKILTKKILSQ